MKYGKIVKGVFLRRPNRFVAHVLVEGREEICHVKNTGRCRELLIPGAAVLLEHRPAAGRKTAYDLVSVYKGERLINMDSMAPNALAREWLESGGPGFVPENIRAEYRVGDSRYDFYFERGGRRCLMEVKGVTLEENGVVRFPDAPTERGVKHLRGLARAAGEGWDCLVLFVVQMQGVSYLEPNRATHMAFAEALAAAKAAGVKIFAVECAVKEGEVSPLAPVEVRI